MYCTLPVRPASDNIMALGDLLAGYDEAFRIMVCRSLAEEGFEFYSDLPNLQLAREIREVVGWSLDNQGFDQELAHLQMFLEWADHQGVLVDVSQIPDHWPMLA